MKIWPLRTLKAQLLATYFLLVLVSVGGMSLWIAPHFQREAEEQVEHELELEAHLLAATLRESLEDLHEAPQALAQLQDLIARYRSHSESRVLVLDTSYLVLAASEPALAGQIERAWPEFVAAAQGSEQHDVRVDRYSNEERVFAAAPVHDDDGALVGYVQVSLPMYPVRLGVYRSWAAMVGVVVLVLLMTALVSLWLAGRVASPLQALTQAVMRAAEGDFEYHVQPRGPQEIWHLTETFNRMRRQLADLLQRQQEFTANAAHELRSPLTALRLRLEMLRNHPEDRALQEKYLGEMIAEVDYLRTMVSQLLELTAADAAVENARPIDPAPLLYQIVDELMPLFTAKKVTLRVDVPSHLPLMRIWATELQVIIRNLLDNACKYTPAGGKVECSAYADEQYVVLKVNDTGLGITPEMQEKIFERFYRSHTDRMTSGSGLGLSLVRSLVERNRGKITLHSQPGEGTTFTLYFPIVRDERNANEP